MEEFVEMMAENPEFAGGEAITTDRLVEMFAMRGMFASEEDEDDESEEDEDDESEEEEEHDESEEEEEDDSFDSESDGSSWLTDSGDSSDEEPNDFEVWRQRAREFGLYQRIPAAMLPGDDPDMHADDSSDGSGPPELIDSDDEDDSPDSEENARPRTRARTAARRAVRPPPRVQFEAQDVD